MGFGSSIFSIVAVAFALQTSSVQGRKGSSPTSSSKSSTSPTSKSSPSSKSKSKSKSSGTEVADVDAVYVPAGSPELSVVRCDPTSVTVIVNNTDFLNVNQVLWAQGEPTDPLVSLCGDCSPIIRKVTSKTPTDSTGFPCPAGMFCFDLVTTQLTVSEVFGDDIITGFDLVDNRDSVVEAAYGCPHSTTNTTRRANAMNEEFFVEDDVDPDLGETFALTAGQSGGQCSDYQRVQSDGRCAFTNCFVGRDGNGVDCFVCKSTCDNGCGSADASVDLVPDSVPFVFDFGPACCSHDFCYSSNTFSKSECDLRFLRDMASSCPPSGILFFILPYRVQRIVACAVSSIVYAAAVSTSFGDDAYNGAQANQKRYEETPECAAMCPTTQESGGQGGTTLSVDVLSTAGSFEVTYQMFTIPDQLEIFYEGQILFTTGGLVSGGRTLSVALPGDGSSTLVQAVVTAPRSGTAWQISVGCALE